MKEPDLIFTDLFIDFQRMHSYLQMACDQEKDEIRQKYDSDFLLEEGEKLYVKWLHFVARKATKEVMESLKDTVAKKEHPLFTQLFLDLDKIHTYANCLYCEKDVDEKNKLICEIDLLFHKWKDYMLDKVGKDNLVSLILDEDNANGDLLKN